MAKKSIEKKVDNLEKWAKDTGNYLLNQQLDEFDKKIAVKRALERFADFSWGMVAGTFLMLLVVVL